MPNETLRPLESPILAGEPAPDFVLKDQNRGDWSLSEALKKGDVVLCFFPLAFTNVCSTEMKCVNDEMQQWTARGATVVGISCDSFAALRAWADQTGMKQTLLADMHRHVCRAYGFYWPELNVSSRGTVIITKDGSGRPLVKWSQARQPKDAMKWSEVMAGLND